MENASALRNDVSQSRAARKRRRGGGWRKSKMGPRDQARCASAL